jgi:hypothetical protein
LANAVIGVAERAATSLDQALAQAGRAGAARLRQPLCMAIVGRLSAAGAY